MEFNQKLQTGKILNRYKRFFADVELDSGEIIVAHTPNTGSMKTCWEPGWKCAVSFHDDPKRKLKYTLEMTHNEKSWICVNTALPNKLAAEAILAGRIGELTDFDHLKPEAKVGQSRIDILLTKGEGNTPSDMTYVEIKNATMIADDGMVIFPDSVSTRGQKHLRELTELAQAGYGAAMLFVVNRTDVDVFRPATEIDPEYARLLKVAKSAGVMVLAYQCQLGLDQITLERPMSVEL